METNINQTMKIKEKTSVTFYTFLNIYLYIKKQKVYKKAVNISSKLTFMSPRNKTNSSDNTDNSSVKNSFHRNCDRSF